MHEGPQQLSWVPGADVPQRYADMSGDHSAVHLDEALARREGLPGVIMHGMHVLAQVVSHLDRGLAGDQDLSSLSLRFLDVTVPGERITVEFDLLDDAVSFTGSQSGRTVVGSGRAAYRPSLDA